MSFVLNHWDTAARTGMIHAKDGTQPGASAIFKPRNVFILSTTAAFWPITSEIAEQCLKLSPLGCGEFIEHVYKTVCICEIKLV